MGSGAEGDVDAVRGELEFAGAFDEVAEDGVGRRGLVAVGEAHRELAVDAVAQHAECGVEVNGERDLAGECVEVKRADLRGEFVLDRSDPATNDVSRGWCRIMGLTEISLFTATVLIARNLRVADAFAARQAED